MCSSDLYNSEIRAAHAEIVVDDLLMNVFRLHKLRRSNRLNTDDCIVGTMAAYSLILMLK